MARIRTIKPDFWLDEDLASLPDATKLLAIGLLNHSDDKGYFKANEMIVRAAIFPFSEPSLSIHGMLTELSNIGYIRINTGSDGKKYGWVVNFLKHQRINRPTPSVIECLVQFTEDSVRTHTQVTVGKEGKGRERKGKELNGVKPTGRFTPPTIEEVAFYCLERQNLLDPNHFMDHYEANGWMRGKSKIKSWKACVRTWEKNTKQLPQQGEVSPEKLKSKLKALTDKSWALLK
tara:strand:- start:1087 stop:1785 length:699 start_codon:yes stop_codon:yes gene_type:complete